MMEDVGPPSACAPYEGGFSPREGSAPVPQRRQTRLLALALALLLPAAAAAADPPEAGSTLDPGIERSEIPPHQELTGPLAVFAAIEEAWAAEDPDALVEILDPEEKVSFSFTKGGPRGGYFNRDQAYYLLKDMFTYTCTDRFEFSKYWNLDSDGRSPYAVAAREFEMNDGVPHVDEVYISLRKRGEAWYIGEIRSLEH
jgi:hypothetical protein